jgi:hypothetical protein
VHSIITGKIFIREVYCKPSIIGLSNLFNYSIDILKFPYIVFNASEYSSTTNPTYCKLSYNVKNIDGSNTAAS